MNVARTHIQAHGSGVVRLGCGGRLESPRLFSGSNVGKNTNPTGSNVGTEYQRKVSNYNVNIAIFRQLVR